MFHFFVGAPWRCTRFHFLLLSSTLFVDFEPGFDLSSVRFTSEASLARLSSVYVPLFGEFVLHGLNLVR